MRVFSVVAKEIGLEHRLPSVDESGAAAFPVSTLPGILFKTAHGLFSESRHFASLFFFIVNTENFETLHSLQTVDKSRKTLLSPFKEWM
jgi:hypothetical protein